MAEINSDTRDRLVRLEQKFENYAVDMKDTAEKVNKMYDLMNQAKGAKWAILGFAGLTGFLGGKGSAIITALFSIK